MTALDGIRQNRTNWADRCPRNYSVPYSVFTYRFTVAGQQGTYWYHVHMGNTLADVLLVSRLAPLSALSGPTFHCQGLIIIHNP